MISGGTDLSVGQIMAVIGVSIGILIKNIGVSIPIAILVGIAIGIILGCINGFAANFLKIHPMIVTLATMTIFKGISYTLSESKTFYDFGPTYKFIGQGYIGEVSVPVILAIITALIIHFILEKTCFGRFIYAVGAPGRSARLLV